MDFLAVANLMKWPSKCPQWFCTASWWTRNFCKHTRIDTLLSFGFIPLSVVFDLDAEKLTLLILSAAPVFSVGLAEDLDTVCPQKLD